MYLYRRRINSPNGRRSVGKRTVSNTIESLDFLVDERHGNAGQQVLRRLDEIWYRVAPSLQGTDVVLVGVLVIVIVVVRIVGLGVAFAFVHAEDGVDARGNAGGRTDAHVEDRVAGRAAAGVEDAGLCGVA